MKVSFISLGCPKNTVNSEQMLFAVQQAGHEIVPDPEMADAVIINTCAFIESATQEAINTIIEVGRLKEEGNLKYLIVAGCLAQRYRKEILEDLPEVDALIGISSFGAIADVLEQLSDEAPVQVFADKNAPVEELERTVSTGKNYAYLRIAEGCNNWCSFCIIPAIRGKYRSRSMDAIVKEAEGLAAQGYKELIIIAQDVTRYGEDLYGSKCLPTLLKRLCAIDGIGWIRLHYLYPDAFTEELIDTIAEEPKIVKYLDIPIQHINDGILKAMNRRGTGSDIRELFFKLRERIPGVVLRTSIIAGLPGEGEEEFEELCDFLRYAKIERAGVFPYSPEDGTRAALMDRVDSDVAAHRAELLMRIQADVLDEFSNNMIGETLDVLFEDIDPKSGFGIGRCYADSPDIDLQVFFDNWHTLTPGTIIPVFIKDTAEGNLIGSAVTED
ncbi:MAG: 30S ribosomal protein S12 methylthiotransferase RimO [Oscillospiraceae bacterium]|nr:30S ribosomal protein S12 methylthiotransferase RimO [Oscillospiraceae bacterium]